MREGVGVALCSCVHAFMSSPFIPNHPHPPAGPPAGVAAHPPTSLCTQSLPLTPHTLLQILFLLPFRNAAFKTVMRLLRFAVEETRKDSVQNRRRFVEEFGPEGGWKMGFLDGTALHGVACERMGVYTLALHSIKCTAS